MKKKVAIAKVEAGAADDNILPKAPPPFGGSWRGALMVAIAKVEAGAAVKDLSHGGSWRGLNNHAAPLMKKWLR